MLSLYLAGHVSDWLGRRRVILGSLLINIAAAIVFLIWNDVAGLITARFLSGLGIGALTATATAYLSELDDAADGPKRRTAIVSTFANLGGIGLGPLIGGLIAAWSSTPLITPYLMFGFLLVTAGGLVVFVPETVERQDDRPAYRPQRIAIPAEIRGAFWAAASAAFGAFAVFGTFMGLSSTFLVDVLAQHSHLLAGVAPFIVFMAAAVAQIVTFRISLRQQVVLAIALAASGLITIGSSALTTSLPLFLIGGGITGAGIGIIFRGALGTTAAVAAPEHRGEALAGIFLIAYAGMTIPLCSPQRPSTSGLPWPSSSASQQPRLSSSCSPGPACSGAEIGATTAQPRALADVCREVAGRAMTRLQLPRSR